MDIEERKDSLIDESSNKVSQKVNDIQVNNEDLIVHTIDERELMRQLEKFNKLNDKSREQSQTSFLSHSKRVSKKISSKFMSKNNTSAQIQVLTKTSNNILTNDFARNVNVSEETDLNKKQPKLIETQQSSDSESTVSIIEDKNNEFELKLKIREKLFEKLIVKKDVEQ